MEFYQVICRSRYSGVTYVDSSWQHSDNADKRVEEAIAELIEEHGDNDSWHVYIKLMNFSD